MRTDVDAIARAVLYEGYSLYPYRASALKNRRRILFGTLMPAAWAEAQGSLEPSEAKTECLLVAKVRAPFVHCSLRFLRLGPEPREKVVEMPLMVPKAARVASLTGGLACSLEATAVCIGDRTYRLRVAVRNVTSVCSTLGRDDVEPHAMGAAHVVLSMDSDEGTFVSSIDPPLELVDAAERCRNVGLYPVLVGPKGRTDTVLASPIILYDHPEVAAESTGDLFDATEIEEILSLRIQTLTDAEKRELSLDPRTRALLARIDALSPEDLARLHGTLREPALGHRVSIGARVRVHPKKRADALDVVLRGMSAEVVAIEHTVEGVELVCVTMDADPGKDLGAKGFPGHRFFFRRDEIEVLP
jgi:hypothetical protein